MCGAGSARVSFTDRTFGFLVAVVLRQKIDMDEVVSILIDLSTGDLLTPAKLANVEDDLIETVLGTTDRDIFLAIHSLQTMSENIVNNHGGILPSTKKALKALKVNATTINVILQECFGCPEPAVGPLGRKIVLVLDLVDCTEFAESEEAIQMKDVSGDHLQKILMTWLPPEDSTGTHKLTANLGTLILEGKKKDVACIEKMVKSNFGESGKEEVLEMIVDIIAFDKEMKTHRKKICGEKTSAQESLEIIIVTGYFKVMVSHLLALPVAAAASGLLLPILWFWTFKTTIDHSGQHGIPWSLTGVASARKTPSHCLAGVIIVVAGVQQHVRGGFIHCSFVQFCAPCHSHFKCISGQGTEILCFSPFLKAAIDAEIVEPAQC